MLILGMMHLNGHVKSIILSMNVCKNLFLTVLAFWTFGILLFLILRKCGCADDLDSETASVEG